MRRYEVGVGGVNVSHLPDHIPGGGGELMDDRLCEQPTAAKLGEESLHPETLIYLKTTIVLDKVKAPMLIGPIRAGNAKAVLRFINGGINAEGSFADGRQLGTEFPDVIDRALEFPVFDIEDVL